MSEQTTSSPRPFLTESQYRWLKALAQVILPALGTLYFTLASIWGLPKADEVVGTVMAVDLFLGVFLTFDKARYDKSDVGTQGTVDILKLDNDKKALRMNFAVDPEEFEDRDRVTLKVNNELDRVYKPEDDTSV